MDPTEGQLEMTYRNRIKNEWPYQDRSANLSDTDDSKTIRSKIDSRRQHMDHVLLEIADCLHPKELLKDLKAWLQSETTYEKMGAAMDRNISSVKNHLKERPLGYAILAGAIVLFVTGQDRKVMKGAFDKRKTLYPQNNDIKRNFRSIYRKGVRTYHQAEDAVLKEIRSTGEKIESTYRQSPMSVLASAALFGASLGLAFYAMRQKTYSGNGLDEQLESDRTLIAS